MIKYLPLTRKTLKYGQDARFASFDGKRKDLLLNIHSKIKITLCNIVSLEYYLK